MENLAEEDRYFEDYLKETGWGLYHNIMLGVVSACQFTSGVTCVIISYAVVLSSCDEGFIPEINVLRMYTSLLLGSGIGGLITSSLSDRYGRKRFLILSLILMFIAAFAAAFSYNAVVLVGATLILGVGMETNATQARLLLVEILSKKRRGIFLTFSNMFWVLGCIITTFFVILYETPTIFKTEIQSNVQPTTWRVMFATCGGAALILACVCALIEESPRYYLHVDRVYMAYLLMKQLFAINKSSFGENFKVTEEELKNVIKPYNLHYVEPEQNCQLLKKLLWRFLKSCRLMCSKRFFGTTWVLMLVKIPLLTIGLLQLNIILAKHLTNIPSPISQNYRSLDFIYPILKPLSYMSKEELIKSATICQVNEDNRIFYEYYLILIFAIIPGQCLSLVVDRLGRKCILFAGFLLSSASCLAMTFFQQKEIQVIATCITMASIGSVLSIISLVNLESYPTAIRGTSNAITSFPAYLLAIIFINLIIIDHQMFILTLGVLYVCLSVFTCTCFLAELKGKPMVE